MQAAKNAIQSKYGWQRVIGRYRLNIYWCIFGGLLIWAGTNHLTTRAGLDASDLVAMLLGAFAVGASSHPALVWFKRQWESED